jgi:hypothetical protein
MKQPQSWSDTASLLIGGRIARSTRPHERLYVPEKWQEAKPQSQFIPIRAVRLLYARMKS